MTSTPHGLRRTYVVDGCRCDPCRAANTTYARQRSRRNLHAQHGAATPLTVHVDQARALVAELQQRGWSYHRIADRTGLRREQLSRIGGGTGKPVSRVRWATYRSLHQLLDETAPTAPAALVDATGTWRRLQALIAAGWPKSHLAARLGVGRSLQYRQDLVQQRNADKVRALYTELSNTPGPDPRAATYAARRGWLTPGWWDDDRIDDPTYDPRAATLEPVIDDVAVERALAGEPTDLTREEHLEVARRLVAAGATQTALAKRLHLNGRTAQALYAQVAS